MTGAALDSTDPRRAFPVGWARWLFLGVLAVYLFTAAGQFQTVDAAQELSVALSMRHGHDFQSDFPIGPAGGTTVGRGGNTYSGHDIGSSLLYLPFTVIPGAADRSPSDTAGPDSPEEHRLLPSRRLYFAASFLPPILSALIVVAFAALLRELGFDPTSVIITAVVLAFTTTVWVYAHVSFDSTATALAMIAGLLSAVRFGRTDAPGDLFVAGACLGAAVLVRVDSILMVPFLAVPALWSIRARHTAWRATVQSVALLAGPVVAAVMIDLAFNWYRFGSVTENGHSDDGFLQFTPRLGEGVFGQLVSPGKGMLVFSPLLIVALFRWRWFTRRHTVVAASIAGGALTSLLAHSVIVGWAGDQAWGARFTVPIVPLAAVPAARVVQEIRAGRVSVAGRIAVGVTAILGFVIQLTGVLSDFFAVVVSRRLRGFDTATSLTHAAYLDGLDVLWRSVSHAQPYRELTPAWVEALHVARFDLWWVRAAQTSGWNVATIVVPVALLALAAFAFFRLWQVLGAADPTRPGVDGSIRPT